MPDLPAATHEDIVQAISYGLRFDRKGKGHNRNREMMALLAAEAVADILTRSGFVILKKPPAPGPAGVGGWATGRETAKPE